MKPKHQKIIIVPGYGLTAENRQTAVFQTRGPHGHELLVLPGRRDSSKHRVVLVKDDSIKMYADLDLTTPGPDMLSPLVTFLQQAFIRDFWQSADNRLYRPGEGEKRTRQNWSELMRDCNSIGFWLNGCRPIRNINNDDIEQQHYVPPMAGITVVGMPDSAVGEVSSVNLRFLCRRARATREVGIDELGENLEHLMVSSDYSADTMNARSYIKQTFIYELVLEADLYEFVGTSILAADADPLTVTFDQNTTFQLNHIHKNHAEQFAKSKGAKRRQADWSTFTAPQKMV